MGRIYSLPRQRRLRNHPNAQGTPAQVVWLRGRRQGGAAVPRLLAGLALGAAAINALADRYGVDEALREGPSASPHGMLVLGACLAAGGALGYLVGRRAARTDPSRDPAGYAVLGALIGGPALALLWVLG